ncbi:MAG: cellulose-binding protein [Marinagarivorans sp.]|nr:cellulose-binding protein [Marinagarivorans sp.]
MQPIDNISPLLAGVVDGLRHQSVGQIDRLAGGVKRTAEGLHAVGIDSFQNVADENYAVYAFATTAIENLFKFEINVLDNPIAQIIMLVVCEYTTALPEWVVEDALMQGALKFPEKIDALWLFRAMTLGIVEHTTQENIKDAVALLNNPIQRFVGKQLGKKLAVALSYAIAAQITKKILSQSAEVPSLKRDLVKIRKSVKSLKGGLGGAMLTLLGTQGHLHRAAEASRRLQQANPRIWNVLRFKLNGANMVYFLVENMVAEYVDRLALLEKNPIEFSKVMAALIKDKKTPAIFFPGFRA